MFGDKAKGGVGERVAGTMQPLEEIKLCCHIGAGYYAMRLRRPGVVTVILAEIIVLARCAAEVNGVRFVGALVVPFPEQSDGVLHNDAFYFRAFKT